MSFTSPGPATSGVANTQDPLATGHNIGPHTFAQLTAGHAAAAVPAGTTAYTTDSGLVVSNGTVWTPIGGSGGAGGGNYPQTAPEAAAGVTISGGFLSYEPYDLRRYGGIGDGLTDNTAAINTWISVGQQSGTCFLYPGLYATTGNHTITVGFNMIARAGGDIRSANYTGFLLTANATAMFTWNGLNAAGPQITGKIIQGIIFDGNSKTCSDALIAMQGMNVITIRDVGIQYVVGNGLRLRQFWDSEFDNLFMYTVDSRGGSGVIVIDQIYNSDVNQNVNNLALRRCHFEKNNGTYIFADPNSNTFILRVDDCKFESDNVTEVGGPYALINIGQGAAVSFYDDHFTNFNSTEGHTPLFLFGNTTSSTSVQAYEVWGCQFQNIDSGTAYISTQGNSTGTFGPNKQTGTNAIGTVTNVSGRTCRFEYPMNTSIQSDVNQLFNWSQNSLSGFVSVDRLNNSAISFTQNANSLSSSQSVISSSASSAIICSLPINPFTGMPGNLLVGVRCFSASGVGTVTLHYNTTIMTAIAAPSTTFGTVNFLVPQAALAVLSGAGSNRFRIETGSGNAEAVTVDGVYFQQVPAVDVQSFSASGTATWTKPANVSATAVTRVILVGPGGGGGSGAQAAVLGTADSGGAGGGAGCYQDVIFQTSALAATITVTIGAGGGGGNATAGTGSGNPGTAASTPSTFGTLVNAFGGGGGGPGASATTSGGGGSGGVVATGATGTSSGGNSAVGGGAGGGTGVAGGLSDGCVGGGGGGCASGAGGSVGGPTGYLAPSGGGAGGGLTAGAATNGGAGGRTSFSAGVGGGSGGATGSQGSIGIAPPSGAYGGGTGGGGGGSGSAGTGGAGNNGVQGGGGGGGGSSVGAASGAGGTGGNGYCVVITTF